MPFGLTNAPGTFVRLMDMVLSGLSWKICLVYLDDIIVFSKTFDEQLKNLETVFQRLKEANLKLNVKKCTLFQTQVSYLGHVISDKGVSTDPEKLKAVQDWKVPKNVKQTRSFLGLCSYYRRFVKNFATIAKPLHQLTEHGKKFVWSEACDESFSKLKEALVSSDILAYPVDSGKFILDTDASNSGLGAVLSQIQEGREKVIAYYSKCFSKTERRYCVTRRELLAIVSSVKHFHHYLYGQNFTVRSDHGSLCWLMNFKNPEGQLARWLETLAAYDFSIEYRAGRIHSNADALSRRPCFDSLCSYCDRIEQKFMAESVNIVCSEKPESIDLVTLCNTETAVLAQRQESSELCQEEISRGDNPENYFPSDKRDSHVYATAAAEDETSSSTGNTNSSSASGSSTLSSDAKGSCSSWDAENPSQIELESLNPERIKQLQGNDPILKQIVEWKSANENPDWKSVASENVELKYYWYRLDSEKMRLLTN